MCSKRQHGLQRVHQTSEKRRRTLQRRFTLEGFFERNSLHMAKDQKSQVLPFSTLYYWLTCLTVGKKVKLRALDCFECYISVLRNVLVSCCNVDPLNEIDFESS